MVRKPAKARAQPSRSPRKSTPPRDTKAPRTPALEWATALLGAGLTVLILAVLGSQVLSSDRSEPSLVVQALGVTPGPGGFSVRVRLTNLGGRPAAQVAVEGVLAGPGEPETSDATFDYIAAHSTREGGLVFTHDPRKAALTLRAKGYVDP